MKNTTTIGFIGAGNIAYALISGLINNRFSAENIKLSDIDKSLLSKRSREFKLKVFTDNTKLASQCDVIILAIKPQVLSVVCKELKAHIPHNPLIISLAAGVKMADMMRWLGKDTSIVRAMPNAPVLLGHGVTGLMSNDRVSARQKATTQKILGAVSECLWVEQEKMLDVVTALSGSGPAYFFLLIESMSKAAVALGLDEPTAERLSIRTAVGAGMMASTQGNSPNALRRKVTSPNGTTQAAIESFQAQNFEAIVAHAMSCAFNRAVEIGFELGRDE